MKVLFVCFHNYARSQMAEGLLRALYGDRYKVHSAGIESSQVDPRAIKVMSEIGVDIDNVQKRRASIEALYLIWRSRSVIRPRRCVLSVE